jgi:DNA adenine methylase
MARSLKCSRGIPKKSILGRFFAMNSFIAWVGGKHILAKKIISMMPEHHCYVEVFGGAGWVLFKKKPSKVEVWNDLNSDLVNLFRTVRIRLDEFKNRQYFLLSSRDEYYTFLRNAKAGNFTDEIDRAIAFYYLIKNSFGSGIFTGWAFGPKRKPKYCASLENLEVVRERLKNVYLDNLSFDKLIPNWDRKETFFYCDPPYFMLLNKRKWGSYYQCTFKLEDHIRLRDMLKGIAGKFILSYDDNPEIRKLYKKFHVTKTEPVMYSMNNRLYIPVRRVSELIITNF